MDHNTCNSYSHKIISSSSLRQYCPSRALPKLGQTQDIHKTHRTISIFSCSPKPSLTIRSSLTTQESEISMHSEELPVTSCARSTTIPTVVDPSHVYNQYHEYQEQIKAVYDEHARLAMPKAEREAAGTAATALTTAKLIQTRTTVWVQFDSERAHEVDGRPEKQGHSLSDSKISGSLISIDQAISQIFRNTRSVPSDPQRQALPEPRPPHIFPAGGRSQTCVLWPEGQQDALANATIKVFNANPESAEEKIAAFQILDMMGYNPTYIELGELIESIGFKLDVGRCAPVLIAEILAVRAMPARPAESKVTEIVELKATKISNKPSISAASKEHQPLNLATYNFFNGSSNYEKLYSDPERSVIYSIEVNRSMSASLRHSASAQDNTAPRLKSPGSRGAYRNRRECLLDALKSQPSSEPRREPERPRKSVVFLGGNHSIQKPLTSVQNPETQTITIKLTDQEIVRISLSSRLDFIGNTLAYGLTGRVTHNPDLLMTSSPKIPTRPEFLSAEPSSESPRENGHLGLHSMIQGRSQAPLAWHTVEKKRDAKGRPIIAIPVTLPPTPLSKEMVTRKRAFAEIIDSTSEDTVTPIEDDALRTSKVRRVGDTNQPGYDGAQEPETPSTSLAFHSRLPITPTITTTCSPKTSPTRHHQSSTLALAIAPPVSNPYRDFKDIARPIDSSIALQKSRYDPKTIARDILIATARHPLQRGLNAHLEPLKERFTRVDDSSDLSTFRWDILDPGGSPVALAEMVASPEIQQEKSLGDAGDSLSSHTLFDGVKLPVGRGPLQPTRGRSSILRNGRSSPLQKQMLMPSQPSGLRFSSTIEPELIVAADSATSEMSNNSGKPRDYHIEGISSPPPTRPHGRPPNTDSTTVQHVKSSPKRIGHPPKSLHTGVSTRGAFTARKIRRPRAHPPAQSKSMGKPRKSDPRSVTPKFIPFLCEWKDCKAELHNLETLRRHVYTVHANVQDSGPIPCRWSKCGLTRQVQDKFTPSVIILKSTSEPKFVHEPHGFGGMQEFKDHMEKAHLVPFAWHMGDGPRGSTLDGSESNASAYLSDAAGNEVTPSIASQAIKGGHTRAPKTPRLVQPKRLYDAALESPVELATPGMRAKFFMGNEWKTIKAPPQDEWGF